MHQSGKYVETDKFYTRFGNTKPDAVFDVFGNYCGKSGVEVHEMMVDYVYKNRKTVEVEFRNALSAKSKDLGWWAVRQTSRKRPGDELTVYLLSKIFDRHSLVYTLKEPWCTFVHKIDDALSTLLSKGDLVFIYITYGFGQIIDLPPALRTKKQRTTKKRKSTAQDNETQQKRCNTNDTKGSAMTHVKPAAKRSNKTPHNRKQYNRSQQNGD